MSSWIYRGSFDGAAGHVFEAEFLELLAAFARQEWGKSAIRFASSSQDTFEGTDAFVLGIPVDVTLAFARKNRTKKLYSLVLDGVTLDFGIRFGNGKGNFKTPTLVIGASTVLEITKSNMWVTLDTIKRYISEIINMGMDEYLAASEA